MNHLRSQVHVADAQRELMQVNWRYMETLGKALSATARSLLGLVSPGIPEHLQGLSGVLKSGEEISSLAASQDPKVMTVANLLKLNCTSCHSGTHADGTPGMGDLFTKSWTEISAHCAQEGKNPYLCKSMNGMITAFGYLQSAESSKLTHFEMTEQAASEIVRILEDLKAKNYQHLPEALRMEALEAAREVQLLARSRNPGAFVKGTEIINACLKCHDSQMGPVDTASLSGVLRSRPAFVTSSLGSEANRLVRD